MGREPCWSWVELLPMEELLAGFGEMRDTSLLAILRGRRAYSVLAVPNERWGSHHSLLWAWATRR